MLKKKFLSVATLAALIGGGAANAEWKANVQMQQTWEPLSFRTSDSTDEQKANAHSLEKNGVAAGTVGDTSDEETGLAFLDWDDNKNRYMGMSLKNDNFGASATFKFKPDTTFAGNGYVGWATFGAFEVRFSGNAAIGYGDITSKTGGEAYGWQHNTASLYAWEIERLGAADKKDEDTDPYYIYNAASAGSPIMNKDGGYQLGVQWTQKLSDKNQLILRLVNQSGGRYTDGSTYGNMQPDGLNFQANLKMDKWAASSTFKIRGSEWDGATPTASDFSLNVAASTTAIKNLTLAAGYTLGGMNIGSSEVEVAVDTNKDGLFEESATFGKDYYGHAVNLGASYKWNDITFNVNSATTLIFLSDYNKALSNANKYNWKPYLGEVLSFGITKPLAENMTGNLGFGFNDYNLNSRTNGKAEAQIWARPNVTIQASRGNSVNIALNASLSNFSDEAKGWWGLQDVYDTSGTVIRNICYTYPRTLFLSVPITFYILL